jgi:hypothetical protein
MVKLGIGGANTRTGLDFEEATDLRKALLAVDGIEMRGNDVYVDGDRVATLFGKAQLYSSLLKPNKVDYKDYISKQLLPDEAILGYAANMLTIVEKKNQIVKGSVDEKLQTCDFKLKQYRRLMGPLGIDVQYAYVLNDWFKQDGYRDTLAYIEQMGCFYFFNELPLSFLKLGLVDAPK